MKNERLENRLQEEILSFIDSCNSLMLASLDDVGDPFASYAPFAVGDDCLYVLISEIAIHATNLTQNPRASVLVVEDEGAADNLFARLRVQYKVDAEIVPHDSEAWRLGVDTLAARHGDRIHNLSELGDFKLSVCCPGVDAMSKVLAALTSWLAVHWRGNLLIICAMVTRNAKLPDGSI